MGHREYFIIEMDGQIFKPGGKKESQMENMAQTRWFLMVGVIVGRLGKMKPPHFLLFHPGNQDVCLVPGQLKQVLRLLCESCPLKCSACNHPPSWMPRGEVLSTPLCLPSSLPLPRISEKH